MSVVVRSELRRVADANTGRVAAASEEALRPYREDPLAFIERLEVWDPRELRFEPFRVWPHQEELVGAWVEVVRGEDGPRLVFHNVVCDKSRQMGDTVVLAAACLWIATHWDAPLLMQHQDLAEVCDSGPTWDSFFGKIKILWQRQPREIGRANLVVVGGNDPMVRNAGHPQRFVVGEGQTPDPGRGGRYAGAVIDEAARLRWDEQGQAALRSACPDGRVMLSTPHGSDNVFTRIRQRPPSGWTALTHHWRSHPLFGEGLHVAAHAPDAEEREGRMALQETDEMRTAALGCRLCVGTMLGARWDPARASAHRYPGRLTSPWYEEAIAELTDEQVAEELDVDYAGSLSARVYEEFTDAVHVVDLIPFDPSLRIELSWDYGLDCTAVGVWQDAPTELRKIGEFEGADAVPEDVWRDVQAVLRGLGVPDRELAPGQTRAWLQVGDPAGEARSLSTNRSLTSDYLTAGASIVSRPFGVAETITALKRLLVGRPKPVRYSRAGCPLTIEHMRQNRWPTDAHGRRRPGAMAPLDDRHNHMCRADAYLVTWKYPPPVDLSTAPDRDTPRVRSEVTTYEGVSAEAITREMGF